MKSKRRKRVIASVLCMVLMLSTGISTLAEADAGAVPAVEETTAAQTTTQETESTSTETKTVETETQAQEETETQTETEQTEEAVQTKQEEMTAAQPTEEASSGETTQTEQTTAENTPTFIIESKICVVHMTQYSRWEEFLWKKCRVVYLMTYLVRLCVDHPVLMWLAGPELLHWRGNL